jgi:hypothetical protein
MPTVIWVGRSAVIGTGCRRGSREKGMTVAPRQNPQSL